MSGESECEVCMSGESECEECGSMKLLPNIYITMLPNIYDMSRLYMLSNIYDFIYVG